MAHGKPISNCVPAEIYHKSTVVNQDVNNGFSWFTKSRRAQSVDDYETWAVGGVSPTLNAFDNADETRATVIAFSHTQGLDAQPSITAFPTLRTEGGGHAAMTPSAVRRLTPNEVERLQGFPDGWTAGQHDSHRYRQMGNAVTVNVANFVAWCFNHNAGGGL